MASTSPLAVETARPSFAICSTISAGARYKTKRDVESLAREIFERKAVATEKPGASQRLSDFIAVKYLPTIENRLRPSAVFGYKHIFTRHIKKRLGDI
jgi:hypothetical protein